MGREDPLSSCFSLLRGSQLKASWRVNVNQLDEAPRPVKEEGAQTSNSELPLPERAFPQKQAEDLKE